jgi:hypothetical protein
MESGKPITSNFNEKIVKLSGKLSPSDNQRTLKIPGLVFEKLVTAGEELNLDNESVAVTDLNLKTVESQLRENCILKILSKSTTLKSISIESPVLASISEANMVSCALAGTTNHNSKAKYNSISFFIFEELK